MNKYIIMSTLLLNLSAVSKDIKTQFFDALQNDADKNATLRFGKSFTIGIVQGIINGKLHETRNGSESTEDIASRDKNFRTSLATLAAAHAINSTSNAAAEQGVLPNALDLWGLGCGEVIGSIATRTLSAKSPKNLEDINLISFINTNLFLAAAGTGLWAFQKVTGKK